ncbi:MAG: hypothetical protein ACE5OZ_20770 [Candidatus Heimdallarchaeota archaeon]
MEAQYDTWRDLIQRNASFEERLEQTRLLDYVKAAKQVLGWSRKNPRPEVMLVQ